MGFVKGVVGSFGASMCFALLFHIPRRCLVAASVTGLVGYVAYMLAMLLFGSPIGANFIGAFIAALLSEWLARRQKAPAIIYSMIGIVPLVPGAGLYRTMLGLVLKKYDQALAVGVETVLIAAGIAFAVALVTVMMRLLRHVARAN